MSMPVSSLQFPVLFTLAILLTVTKCTLVIQGESFENTDFWFMPNSYNVQNAPLIKAEFLNDASCKMNTTDAMVALLDNAVLFVDFADAVAAHGCFFYGEVIEDVKKLNPLVTVFASQAIGVKTGTIWGELYGYYETYELSGLALTFLNASSWPRINEILKTTPNSTVSITAYVGDWIIFGQSPNFQAFQWIFVSVHGIYVIYIIARLVEKFVKEGITVSIPISVYVLCCLCSLFRLLEIAIDSSFMFHRLTYWGRYLLYWTGLYFGYCGFMIICLSWVTFGSNLNVHKTQQRVSRFILGFGYFSLFHLLLAIIVIVVTRAYSGNRALYLASRVFYISIAPNLLFVSILFFVYGIRILVILRKTAAMNDRAKIAFRKVTLLLVSSVLGFFVMVLNVGLSAFPFSTIPPGMATTWLTEIGGLWMIASVLSSLMLHHAPSSTKKTNQATSNPGKAGSGADHEMPNRNLEKLCSELESTSKGDGQEIFSE